MTTPLRGHVTTPPHRLQVLWGWWWWLPWEQGQSPSSLEVQIRQSQEDGRHSSLLESPLQGLVCRGTWIMWVQSVVAKTNYLQWRCKLTKGFAPSNKGRLFLWSLVLLSTYIHTCSDNLFPLSSRWLNKVMKFDITSLLSRWLHSPGCRNDMLPLTQEPDIPRVSH